VGWRIDIKSEEEKRREVEAEMARMARAVDEVRSLGRHGVGDTVVQKLVEAGVHGLGQLFEMSDDELEAIEGVGPKTVEKIREAAVEARLEWEARDAAEEAERLAAEQEQEQEQEQQQTAPEAGEAQTAGEAGVTDAEGSTPAPAPVDATEAAGTGEEGGTDGER